MEASKRADKSSSVWERGDSLVTLSCKMKEKLDYKWIPIKLIKQEMNYVSLY